MTQGRKFKIGKSILEVKNISLSFGGVKAITDISFDVFEHEIRALIGPNGAGKSSLLNCINGIYKPQEGQILFKSEILDKITPNIIAQKGISRTFQNLALFKRMSVLDNILVGRKLHSKANFFEVALQLPRATREEKQNREKCEEIIKFLEIENIKNTPVGKLPYGLQKKVELGRALATEANILLLDEPSMGLAPQLVAEIFNIVKMLNEKEGVSILLAEQNTNIALKNSDYGYILETGKIMLEGSAKSLLGNDKVKELYLGISKGKRLNFRDAIKDNEKKINSSN